MRSACTEMAGELVGCDTMNSTLRGRPISPGPKRRSGSGPSRARGSARPPGGTATHSPRSVATPALPVVQPARGMIPWFAQRHADRIGTRPGRHEPVRPGPRLTQPF